MKITIFLVFSTIVSLCATCTGQATRASDLSGVSPESRAKLQQTIPPKPGGRNPIIQEIRDDGSGSENKNSPVLGSKPVSGCVSTDTSHPCPPQPPPTKTTKDNVPTKADQ
jgi:hypothetical protein